MFKSCKRAALWVKLSKVTLKYLLTYLVIVNIWKIANILAEKKFYINSVNFESELKHDGIIFGKNNFLCHSEMIKSTSWIFCTPLVGFLWVSPFSILFDTIRKIDSQIWKMQDKKCKIVSFVIKWEILCGG